MHRYNTLWEQYINWFYDNLTVQERRGLVSRTAGVVGLTLRGLRQALHGWRTWAVQQGLRGADMFTAQCLTGIAYMHKTLTVDGVTFKASTTPEDTAHACFLLNAAQGLGVVARITAILQHQGPPSQAHMHNYEKNDIVLCRPYANANARATDHTTQGITYDGELICPVVDVTPRPMIALAAQDITPVRIVVLPHPTRRNVLVAMHRDARFATAAGFPPPPYEMYP